MPGTLVLVPSRQHPGQSAFGGQWSRCWASEESPTCVHRALVHLEASTGQAQPPFFIEQQEVPRYYLKSHLNLYFELLVLRSSRVKQRAAGFRALGEELRMGGLRADEAHEELGEGSLLRPAVSQSPRAGGQHCGPGLLTPGTAASGPLPRAADGGSPAWRHLTEHPAHHQHSYSGLRAAAGLGNRGISFPVVTVCLCFSLELSLPPKPLTRSPGRELITRRHTVLSKNAEKQF